MDEDISGKPPLTREERRLRREQRRAKQREANVGRAQKMRKLRLAAKPQASKARTRGGKA